MGNQRKAYDILTKLWEEDPQCIDALVHIGNLYIDNKYTFHRAYNCYKTAVYIAEQGLPQDFDGLFLWIQIENRPYLRALHGLCLILWKMEKYGESVKIAEKLLRICPTDNLGIRFIVDKIKNHEEWTDEE